MICSLRIPDVLQARIDSAAGDGKRSEWILEACRMRLDGGRGASGNTSVLHSEVEGSTPSVSTKPDMLALRDICAGKVAGVGVLEREEHVPTTTVPAEIPICGKTWWEDGEHYECVMDKGHREALVGKHGLRGMVRRLQQ